VPTPTPEDFTGLGISGGGNKFQSYLPGGPKAIIDRKEDGVAGKQGHPHDVMAEGNTFYSTNVADIENVVEHDTGNALYGYVAFGQTSLYAARRAVVSRPGVAGLTQTELAPVVVAARARWTSAVKDAALQRKLSQVRIVIADLPGGCLGLTDGNTIYVDRDAAGYGWFVDRTPRADQEFRRVARSLDLRAVDRRAVDRIDLLTVVEHELGHIAGLQDVASDRVGLMKGTLDTGVRRMHRRQTGDRGPGRERHPRRLGCGRRRATHA
jgi:hypothetical protein